MRAGDPRVGAVMRREARTNAFQAAGAAAAAGLAAWAGLPVVFLVCVAFVGAFCVLAGCCWLGAGLR